MKILSCYTPTTQYKYNNPCYRKSLTPLKHDTVCFKSRDFLELPKEEILKRVEASIIPENFLGHGTEAEVYRIKDTGYCVRIPYLATNTKLSYYSRNLEQIDKINHVVAKLNNGISIRKYIDGVVPKWYQNNEYSRHKLQSEISDMPVKSYSEFLHQIANAIDNEMLFDFSSGNLIVNTEKQKLTAIDFFGVSDNPRHIRPLMEMYSTITSFGSLKETGKKIFDKIIDAGLEELKPNNIPCMDVALFDFMDICMKRMEDTHTPKSEKMKSIIMHNSDILAKLKKAEILDKSVTGALEQQLANFKSILRKVP